MSRLSSSFRAGALALALTPCLTHAAPPANPAAEVAVRSLLLDGQTIGRTVVAVGSNGHILRSGDNGATWELVAAPVAATLTGVCLIDARRGWAVGHDAVILHTEDGGGAWTVQYQGADLQASFLDVGFLDAQTGFAIGAYGLFLTTADGGHTWTQRQVIADDYFLNRITIGPTGTLYIAGEHGTLLRSADRGATWTPIPTEYDGSFYGILPLGERTLLAYGLRGRIYRSEDDGATWQLVPNDVRTLVMTAVRLRTGVIVFAGQARMFFLSRDGGRTVAPWSPGLTTGVAELVEAPDGTLLALGEAGATPLPAP